MSGHDLEPEFYEAIAELGRGVQFLSHYATDPSDFLDTLDEIATIWFALQRIHAELGVVVRDYANAAGRILADVEYNPRDGYTLPNGELVHHAATATDKWEGRRLLTDLSWDLVDPDTGETHEAVPTAILEQIIPGTGEDRLTSSKWGVRGLKNLGLDPEEYRSREWQPTRIRKGTKR